jgi:ABC-type uncharacterized transport system substrate-binding protein
MKTMMKMIARNMTCIVVLAALVLASCRGPHGRPSGDGSVHSPWGVAGSGVPDGNLPARIDVGIGTIIDHPALQAAIDRFKEELAAVRFEPQGRLSENPL